MITVTHTETRPTLDVAWYRTPNDFINYIQKYNDIRHRTVYGWTSSIDMLSRTFVVSYSSQADYDIFQNDTQSVEELDKITAHNTVNNITRSKTIS
jgi:hypothetical protein